jgi:hypothetical protein
MGADDADARQNNHFVKLAGDGLGSGPSVEHQERGILNAIRRLNDSLTPKLKIQHTFVWLSK